MFQRIARRRPEDSDETATDATFEQRAQTPAARDASATSDAAPTSESETDAMTTPSEQPEHDPSTTAAETVRFDPIELPTAIRADGTPVESHANGTPPAEPEPAADPDATQIDMAAVPDPQTTQFDMAAVPDPNATQFDMAAIPTPPEPAAAVETTAPAPAEAQPEQAAAEATEPEPERRPGFRERGKMRRRIRYLRKVRELQARDLGGLVFDLRRFERKRDDLVAQKVDQLRACDDELRALEQALNERRDVSDVREPGIGGTCPRCFALHGSADRFCSNCGAALGGAAQGPARVPTPVPEPPAAAPGTPSGDATPQ